MSGRAEPGAGEGRSFDAVFGAAPAVRASAPGWGILRALRAPRGAERWGGGLDIVAAEGLLMYRDRHANSPFRSSL